MRAPPPLVRWLITISVPASEREFVIGDLEEEFAKRGGSMAARWWVWRQMAALLWKAVAHGVRYTATLLGREGVIQDIRLALRLLVKDKSFTVAVLLTLAICIGANTAMFSIVRSVILKPLPFPEADQLVLFYNSYPKQGALRAGSSVPNYYDRQGTLPAVEDVALYQRDERRLGDEQGVERVGSLRATPSLLRLLRVQPAQGRLFTENEAQPGACCFVLLSYELWQRKFGGAPIVNQTIRLNEAPTLVVGILPRGFSFLANDIEIVEPLEFNATQRAENQRYTGGFQMVGRLRPGATIAMAQAQVDALNASLIDRTPELRQRVLDAGFHTVVAPLQEDFVSGVKGMLYLLWGGVALVLIIGCVNVANLVVVRAQSRTREMATRHAIGADLGQLARQLLTESVVLSLAGGMLGILLGAWALRSVGALGLDQLPRGFEIGLDRLGAATIVGLTFVVGIVLGLVPVARLRRMNLNAELREESRSGTSGRRLALARSVMATAQFATAFVVLAGAGLLFASFQAAMHVDLGFQPQNVSTITIELPAPYRNPAAQSLYVRRTLEALQGLPEVDVAGATSAVPFGGGLSTRVVVGEGQSTMAEPMLVTATPGYFRAMSVPFVAGRDFESRDGAGGSDVLVVIDDRLARTFWPGQNAVGRRLYYPRDTNDPSNITPETQFMTVIGVVNEMRFLPPRDGERRRGAVFYTYDQRPSTTLNFVIKARAGGDITGRARAVMAKNDPTVPTYRARSMQEWIDRALVGRRAPMLIAVMFAIAALLLSAVGVYGVIARGVAQRQRELGVRLALGETGMGIFRLVLANGLKIVGVGLTVGAVGAYVAGQVMKSQLFSVAPTSPVVLLAVAVVLSLIAIVASVVPAWRASKINPIVVLGR